jgi:hypothetical protein
MEFRSLAISGFDFRSRLSGICQQQFNSQQQELEIFSLKNVHLTNPV